MKLGKFIATAVLFAALATVAHAADKQKLIIATEGAYPPYNFVAADGSLQGFDVDFANAVCEKINATCEIVKQDWYGIIPALLAKKYDVIIASMAIRPERLVHPDHRTQADQVRAGARQSRGGRSHERRRARHR